MKYFLLIWVVGGGAPALQPQVGPFSSALACEAAASQAVAAVPRDRFKPRERVETVCVASQIRELVIPKVKS